MVAQAKEAGPGNTVPMTAAFSVVLVPGHIVLSAPASTFDVSTRTITESGAEQPLFETVTTYFCVPVGVAVGLERPGSETAFAPTDGVHEIDGPAGLIVAFNCTC